MQIKQVVDELCNKHESNDPFILASCLGTIILFERLGTVRGYYSRSYNQKVIHINSEASHDQQAIICAHELGHSILHPNLSTPFLRENTLFSINKLELQANKFMVQLLVRDQNIKDRLRGGYTSYQIGNLYGLPERLIEYKIRTLKGGVKYAAKRTLLP